MLSLTMTTKFSRKTSVTMNDNIIFYRELKPLSITINFPYRNQMTTKFSTNDTSYFLCSLWHKVHAKTSYMTSKISIKTGVTVNNNKILYWKQVSLSIIRNFSLQKSIVTNNDKKVFQKWQKEVSDANTCVILN